MLKPITGAMITVLFMISSIQGYESLQDVYNQAEGSGEYDKYLELDPETEYLGDLFIDFGVNARIMGNGAIIHGTSNSRAIWVFGSNLDISNCIVVGGLIGIHFDTLSTGSIYNNTVVNCDSIGITLFYHNYNPGAEVWDNIIVGGIYGFICMERWRPNYLGYNTVYSSSVYRYGDYCPG